MSAAWEQGDRECGCARQTQDPGEGHIPGFLSAGTPRVVTKR